MNVLIRESDADNGARVLPQTLVESPQQEQADSRETVIAPADQRTCGFIVVLLRALSALPAGPFTVRPNTEQVGGVGDSAGER